MGPAGEAASAAGPAPRRVAVFLGASKGTSPAFQRAAEAVGPALAAMGLELVYGGGASRPAPRRPRRVARLTIAAAADTRRQGTWG